MSFESVHIEGRGIVPVVGHDPENRNVCGGCGSTNVKLENYSMMWHDGDMVCQDCGGYVRMWDAG